MRTIFLLVKFFKKTSIHLIYIVILLIICILINISVYYKTIQDEREYQSHLLDCYAERIGKLISKDFKKIFQHGYKLSDLSIITNFTYKAYDEIKPHMQEIYVSNNTLHIKNETGCLIIDISNVKKILDDISKDLFLYSLSINGEKILTNTLNNLKNNKLLSIPITQDTMLSISGEHYKYSPLIMLSNVNIKNKAAYTLFISSIMFFIGIFIIFWLLRQKMKLIVEINHKKNILLFVNKEREFITQCYEYSKKSRNNLLYQDEIKTEYHDEYLPLSIVSEDEELKEVELLIERIIEPIQDYFLYYKSYYDIENVELDFNFIKLKYITVPFDYEVFYQIFISIIYNLMNFNKKSSDKRKIEINFKKSQIIIFSDGLKLNKEYAIKASKMIFQDSVNPYLMNFGQIFVLFNRYNIEFNVFHKNNGTTIVMILPYNKKTENITLNSVIDINQYKKRKKDAKIISSNINYNN